MDKNNSLGYAISKSLPTGGFKWLPPAKFDLDKYDDNSSRGSILEDDLECSKELHKLHNDYPLAQNKLEIKRKMLSNYQLKIMDDYNISIGNFKKTVPNSFDKEKYVLHYENVQLYLRLRLKIKRVDRVLKFDKKNLTKMEKHSTNYVTMLYMVKQWKT